MSKKIANSLCFIILIVPINYYQLGTLAEPEKPCQTSDGKSNFQCPAFAGNYPSNTILIKLRNKP